MLAGMPGVFGFAGEGEEELAARCEPDSSLWVWPGHLMGSRSYAARVMVLRKRKLSESDLILQLLKQDGSLVDVVAKGARKPTNTFATRMELFNVCDCLLARGRNLDVLTEARVVTAREVVHATPRLFYAAAPIVDCISRTAQPDLSIERLFDMADSALDHLVCIDPAHAVTIPAAYLIKHVALLGVRPGLYDCVSCGLTMSSRGSTTPFSIDDGGVLCSECTRDRACIHLNTHMLDNCRVLLASTFDQVVAKPLSTHDAFAVLDFEHRWLRDQVGVSSKALQQLLTCALFD